MEGRVMHVRYRNLLGHLELCSSVIVLRVSTMLAKLHISAEPIQTQSCQNFISDRHQPIPCRVASSKNATLP